MVNSWHIDDLAFHSSFKFILIDDLFEEVLLLEPKLTYHDTQLVLFETTLLILLYLVSLLESRVKILKESR